MINISELKTKSEVNIEINKIFQKYSIKPNAGLDSFWDAVDDVKRMNTSDGILLMRLGTRWERINT